MYEKISLIVSILFAIESLGKVSSTRTKVWNADFSDSRLSSILFLPSTHNDDQHFTETKANRGSVFLLAPLPKTRSKQRQPKEATQKTKRCITHRRRSRLSSAKDFAKTKDSNVNDHVKTSRNIPHVSAINTKYSSEDSATTSWMEVGKRVEDKTLLRNLQDSLLRNAQDPTVNVDFQKEAKRCNKFVCYCQEENCVRKSSRTNSSRMLGSSRGTKTKRVNRRRPIGRVNARPILDASVLRPGSPRWYHEARHNPHILDLLNSVPTRPHQKLTYPAFFAPLLHGVPLVVPHMIGKGGKFADFPYTSFESRPDFIVGDNVHLRRRPIFRQDSQECRHSSQENRFDVSTDVSTTSAWSNVGATANSNEESSTTEFSSSRETIAANYLGGLISPVTESNVELKDITESNEINAAETLPSLSATFSTDYVASATEAGTKDYFESYSSSGTVEAADLVDEQSPRFVMTPRISYANARTDSGTRSELNPYYSETTAMSSNTDQSQTSTDLSEETTLSWTNRPSVETESSFDQRMNDFVSTSTESYEYTRWPTELDEYAESIYESNENYDAWHSDKNGLSSVNKHILMKKFKTEPTIDEDLEENTRGGLLGKSKSHETKMLSGPSYDGGSTTENSLGSEKFLCSTISYECNEDVSDLTTTNAIRGDSWSTSARPFSRRVYETTTPYYESTTDRNSKEGAANILIESITGSHPWRATLQDQLTTAQYSNREKTNDHDKGESKYTTESLVGITESSTKGFCDNSLLLSSIKRVINNFASSDDLTKAQYLDEDALRSQGKSLLPEILQILDLGNILSTPRIEDTIVRKVKGVLSNIKGESNFADGWSYGEIRNALRKLLDSFRGFHRERKFPSVTTVMEHQFDHGEWRTKLVTLPPVYVGDNFGKLSMAPKHLREGIRDLLGIPAIASQADRQVVRNMIVQSLKNNLVDNGEGEDRGLKIEDSVILNALHDMLQAMRGSKGMSAKDTPEGGDENSKYKSVDDKGDTSLTANPLPGATTISSTNVKAFREGTENILNSMSTMEDVEVQRNNEEARDGESWEHTTTHQRPSKIYQQSAEVSQQRSTIYVPQKTAGCATKDAYTTEGTSRDNVLYEAEHVGEPSETSKTDILSFAKIYNEVATDLDETTTEMAKQNSFTSKSFASDEASDKAPVALAPNSMLSSADGGPQVSTANFHNESQLEGRSDDEATQRNAMDPMEEHFSKYDETDPTIMRATNDIDAPPINYYSPNDRILDYMKSHRVDNEDETASTTVSFMRKSSPDYARLSDEATLKKNTAAAKNAKHEMKHALNENAFSRGENTIVNSISPANANDCGSRKAEITVSPSPADADSLLSQQREFPGDVIKIHEVTTEVQKTYAKTMYFQPRQFDPEDDSTINLPAIVYKGTSVASSNDHYNRNSNNNDGSDDPSDKKIDNVGDIATGANESIVSATGLPSEDVSDILQVFPSPNASEDSIEQLQKSQLYYISDGVKLPLEITRLKDGTYALSISKNICEQILKRKCCVPLQGHVVQSPRPDARANNVEDDCQSGVQPLSSTTTLRNTLQKLEEEAEEELNMYRLSNYRRKRDLIGDNSMATVSMPVLDFARKYNLSLDFDEKDMALNELRSSGRIRNFGDSLRQLAKESEYNRLNEKNFNGYSMEMEKSGLHDQKNGKVRLQGSTNTQNNDGENIENLRKTGLQKSHANASPSTKVKTSKLRKLEDKDENQQTVKQMMNTSDRVNNSISKETDIFKEAKFKSNQMKWGDFEILVKKRGEIPEEIKLIKLKKDHEGNEQHVEQYNKKIKSMFHKLKF